MLTYSYSRFVKDFFKSFFFPALMAAGIIASRNSNIAALSLAVVNNYLLMIVSFMYNDIEDRVEDANSPSKRFKNPFGYKTVSIQTGYSILLSIVCMSLLISYYQGGVTLMSIAATNVLIGVLYSYKRIRLKSIPLLDVISHAYMLASVQILYFMYLPGSGISKNTLILLGGVTCISIGGSLYNQLRDYEDDKKAKIKNTASVIGKSKTRILTFLFYAIGLMIAIAGII